MICFTYKMLFFYFFHILSTFLIFDHNSNSSNNKQNKYNKCIEYKFKKTVVLNESMSWIYQY